MWQSGGNVYDLISPEKQFIKLYMYYNYKHANTCTKRLLWRIFSVLYISELRCSFLQFTHSFWKLEKKKDYIKKKKVKRKYFWRKEIKRVARRPSLPTTPQRSAVRQLSTNKSSGRGPCRRFQQHSGIKKKQGYSYRKRRKTTSFCLPHPILQTSTVQCQETTSSQQERKSQVSSQSPVFFTLPLWPRRGTYSLNC